jgi:adenylate cyclase
MTGETPKREKHLWIFGVTALAFLMAAGLHFTGWLGLWEARTWDWRVRLMAEKGNAADEIVLVLVDQNSLDWGREVNGWPWPWPREVYGAIINYSKRSGAKALALDVLFTEPSGYGKSDDAALGKAISEFGKICGAVFLGEGTGSSVHWPQGIASPNFKISGIKNRQPATAFPRAAFPIPDVSQNAAMLCNAHLEPDPDGIYRRLKPFGCFDGRHLPVMGLGCFLVGRGENAAIIKKDEFQVGTFHAPLDPHGNVILRYGPAGVSYKIYSAAAVIQSELRMLAGEPPTIPDTALKNKYVFLGFSAPGLYDLRPSPVSGVYPGVCIHATFLDNLLSQDFIDLAPLWVTLLLTGVLAFACALSVAYPARIISVTLFSAIFLLLPIPLSLLAYHKGYWLPLMVPEIACMVSIFLGLAVKYATEGQQKRFIKNAFRQYLSPAVIEQIIAHPERLRLGGEHRMLTMFFSDLQGFTSISENLTPDALTQLLNNYLTAMTDIIIDLGGTVDKYEGDAIIAFWNAPLEIPGHASKCVEAALRCQERLSQMRPEFYARTGHELHMRIGINTGFAIVGNFGSHTKFDYTMLGDAVNLAARLEGINKQFGTYTMISEFTRKEIGDDFAFREIGRVAVVGRKQAVTVFEPLRPEVRSARKEILNAFEKGLALFYAGEFEQAKAIFEANSADPPSAAYGKKCAGLLKNPPPDWTGVWIMTEK